MGALLPALNLADNENARLARTAFLHASRTYDELTASMAVFERTGLLHIALERVNMVGASATARPRSRTEQAARMQNIIERHRFPANYVRWIDADEGARRAGTTVGGPGWWIPAGGWVRPSAMCEALLAASASHLNVRFGTAARRIVHRSDLWQVIDACGSVIAEAPTIVVANAHAAAHLGLDTLPRLIAVRGQISCVPAELSPRLDCVVCGDGYVAPLRAGGLCVGATFEPGNTALDIRAEDHAQNLHRLTRMLPASLAAIGTDRLTGRAALRTATADRLPACGELMPPLHAHAESTGLHLFSGLGARGLIWAPLCADVLASQLEGEPNPVESSLIHAMRPARDAMAPPT